MALLIFADHATDQDGLEDYARLMYPKVTELNVPTWVIGPPTGTDPPPERPADILKIWPEHMPILIAAVEAIADLLLLSISHHSLLLLVRPSPGMGFQP